MHDSRLTRVVLGVLLIAAVGLITVDARGGGSGPLQGLRSAGSGALGSAEGVIGGVSTRVSGFFGGFGGSSASQSQVAALQRQVLQLRGELSQARLSKADEVQLQQLLQLAGRGGYRIVAANVIAASTPYGHAVTIDAGEADGIKPQETVLNSAGLVGIVTAVTAHTATVQLATDPATTVGVRVAGTGELGAVTGSGLSSTGPPLLRLQVFDATAVLRPGQQLVTFGSVGGRPYVPGVPVGVVLRAVPSPGQLTKLGYVRLFANESTLGVVGVVIVPPRTNPRDSVLPNPPPSPKPSPSASRRPHAHPTASASAGAGAGG